MGNLMYSADTYKNYLDFKKTMSPAQFEEYSKKQYVQDTVNAHDILAKLAALKCKHIDITILACNAGEGEQGKLLRRQILDIFGPNATVHTYQSDCGFMIGGIPTSKGDPFQTLKNTESN